MNFNQIQISDNHRWTMRAANGEVVAASTESYTEHRGAIENLAQVLGAGILAGHHVIPDADDRAAVMAAIEVRYGPTDPFDYRILHVQAVNRSLMWMDQVLTNAAAGNWDQLVEDVGDCLNGEDAVDEDSINLWNRAKAAAAQVPKSAEGGVL